MERDAASLAESSMLWASSSTITFSCMSIIICVWCVSVWGCESVSVWGCECVRVWGLSFNFNLFSYHWINEIVVRTEYDVGIFQQSPGGEVGTRLAMNLLLKQWGGVRSIESTHDKSSAGNMYMYMYIVHTIQTYSDSLSQCDEVLYVPSGGAAQLAELRLRAKLLLQPVVECTGHTLRMCGMH